MPEMFRRATLRADMPDEAAMPRPASSSQRGYAARRKVLIILALAVPLLVANYGMYAWSSLAVRKELNSIAQSVEDQASNALGSAGQTATEVANARYSQRGCFLGTVQLLQLKALSSPYVRSLNLVRDGKISCSSVGGAVNIPVDLFAPGLRLQTGSVLLMRSHWFGLEAPGIAYVHMRDDHDGVIAVMHEQFFRDMTTLPGKDRYRSVVLRLGHQYVYDEGGMKDSPPKFVNQWVAKRGPGDLEVFVEASDKLRMMYLTDSVVTWNLIAIAIGLLLALAVNFYYVRGRSFERMLRLAIVNRDIVPFYQPVYHAEGAVLEGVEILARWYNRGEGYISPDVFIPYAERMNLIDALTLSLIQQVRHDLEHSFRLPPGSNVALNVPPSMFDKPEMIAALEQFSRFLQGNGLRLLLEVTERQFVEHADTERIQGFFDWLHQQGILIALDDFGTGYSSMGYLNRFSFDYLKIDGVFVNGIGASPTAEGLLDTIIQLAQKLGMKTIAEKVENKEQVLYLVDRQVNCIQGYYYAKPVSAAELAQYIPDQPPRPIVPDPVPSWLADEERAD
ncbi:EAL domain-containing protein [Chitiniphilus shinanonensis]|nr:EAL domain-containing protein [Chitiniphilus shinanonensis]